MGWWKIKDAESGQVDSEATTTTATATAVPGEEGAECSFCGDGPADVMERALTAISQLYEKTWSRPAKKDELLACFNFCCNGMFPE